MANTKIRLENAIFFFDLDGTLISSEKILLRKQTEGIIRYLWLKDKLNLSGKLSDDKKFIREKKYEISKNLSDIHLSQYLFNNLKITPKEFYTSGAYITFRPDLAIENGMLCIYDDAKRFLEKTKNNLKTIISNSELNATKNKLRDLNIFDKFHSIYAEYKELAKPNTFMGEEALKDLENLGVLDSNPIIYCVGDQKNDILFGKKLKSKYSNIQTIYLDRGNYSLDKDITPDMWISSFDELFMRK